MSINPADAVLGFRPAARRDDVIGNLIRVRHSQERLAADLDLAPTPNIARLREAADVRHQYAELFRDLAIRQPIERSDGNAVAVKLDHLRELQPHGPPEWRTIKLGRLATADARTFEIAEDEIVKAMKALAADRSFGSIHRPDALRPIVRTDVAGRTTTMWCGDPFSWMRAFMPASYDCLTAFGDGRGHWRP